MTTDDTTGVADGSPPERRVREAVGWALTLAAIAYAFAIHNGMGVAPNDNPTAWWHATGFLLDVEWIGVWASVELWSPGIVYLTLPAAALALLACGTTRSAVARSLALSALCSVPIFAFYGLTKAMRIWEFFHWRASVVFALTGLALGCVLAAPFLAHSWLRQRAWVKAALYVPIFIAVVSLVRHATGTDEKLFFNFSPWPAIPVLGLELGAYTVIGALFGGGIALGALGLRGRAPILWALGFAVGLAVPAIWFASRFGAEATPPLIALTLVTGIGVAGTFAAQRGDPRASASLALAILLGAALAFAPLATGRALATGDYVVNKFVRSQILIDALARYYAETDDGYPDELETLIDAGYLETIPKPRLGFELFYQLGWLDRFEFFYRSLGSSYVLEFTSTEWVQCAYNPPWDDEEGEDDEEEDDESDEAWSCPDTRPELW